MSKPLFTISFAEHVVLAFVQEVNKDKTDSLAVEICHWSPSANVEGVKVSLVEFDTRIDMQRTLASYEVVVPENVCDVVNKLRTLRRECIGY